MSRPVRLCILWTDDETTVLDLPSKAAAIDWLATHDTDRPMYSVSILPLAEGI